MASKVFFFQNWCLPTTDIWFILPKKKQVIQNDLLIPDPIKGHWKTVESAVLENPEKVTPNAIFARNPKN